MDAIFSVNKPTNFTSFDVIRKLRKILNIKKIGHGGTLDPLATGVLPIFVGKATKIINLVQNQDKQYIAGFKLGIATDTQDITGKIIIKKDSYVSQNELQQAIQHFLGKIKQIPPMYSAVKINGQRLYNIAKKGKEIERSARNIEIYDIKLLYFDKDSQEGLIKTDVSKGTYIRTLINDIGNKLNVGATLTSLKRTKAMGLTIEKSYSLSEIEKLTKENKLDQILITIENLLKEYPKIHLDNNIITKLSNGQKIKISLPKDGYHLIYNDLNKFIGIGYNKPDGYFKIKNL